MQFRDQQYTHCYTYTYISTAVQYTGKLCRPVTVHLNLLFLLGCLVALSTESVHTPVTASNIMGVKIIQIPPQAPEQVLAWLEQDIHLVTVALRQMVDVLLYVPWRVTGGDDGDLGLEEQRECLFPFVHGGCVAETGVEDDEAVEVGVIGVEVAGLVDVVVVFDESADLHGVGDAVLDDGAKGIEWCALGEWKLLFAVCHGLRANEVQRELDSVEEVGQLHPGLARKRRLSARTEDEEADRRGSDAGVLPGVATTGSGWVECVPEGYADVSTLRILGIDIDLPLKLFSPSGVILPPLRML